MRLQIEEDARYTLPWIDNAGDSNIYTYIIYTYMNENDSREDDRKTFTKKH